MKAMILAAGRGERMRPLTNHTPKPLLQVAGKALIEHTIENLVHAGFTDIVINLAHFGSQIQNYLKGGHQYGAQIQYSDEGETGLETAGGIKQALPLLGSQPFLVVNGDISTDFSFATLKNKPVKRAHLVLINNPEHHPQGDFALEKNGSITLEENNRLTFSGIGIYHPSLFDDITLGKHKLAPLLRKAITQQQVTGEKHNGFWMDIGTPQRLIDLEHHYQQQGK